MSAWFEALEYARYVLQARGPHGVHSPYVFRLITEVLPDKRSGQELAPVELLRQKLLEDQTELQLTDLGAGSRAGNSSRRTISKIVRFASSPPKQLTALYNLIRDSRPACIIELGTNLGLGTCSLALGAPEAEVHTIEGDMVLAKMAREHFHQLGLDHISSYNGAFAKCLPELLDKGIVPDFAVIDGDHRFESTISFFTTLVDRMSSTGIIVLDDIHWSRGMRDAWDQVKNHPKVSLSLDFFHFGVLCFTPRPEKEHFVLRLS